MTTATATLNYRQYMGEDVPTTTEKKAKKVKKQKNVLTRFSAFCLTVFVGVIFVAIVVTNAYASNLQYQINTLISQNAVIEGEIENLNVELKQATNIAIIEQKATEELGMVYPYGSQIVYLENEPEVTADFAMLLKEQAYN